MPPRRGPETPTIRSGPQLRIGTLAEIWRFPVKSMRGERVQCAVLEANGLAGDRRYAVVSSAAPAGKPLLTSRERTAMLRYTPSLDPWPSVRTPSGERLPLPSPSLTSRLQSDLADPGAQLTVEHSPDKPLTDVRPVSFISQSTLDFLAGELGEAFDARRLRNNLVLDLADTAAFAEERLGGQHLQYGDGPNAPILLVHERVPRCRMVTLDPQTAESNPALLRYLAKERQGRVSMYATIVRKGLLTEGATVLRCSPTAAPRVASQDPLASG